MLFIQALKQSVSVKISYWPGVLLWQGTEFFDGKTKRYVDFPITDVLQMMGRAGRPQYDQHGKAVILVYEPKKSFYKKVLIFTYVTMVIMICLMLTLWEAYLQGKICRK